MSSGPTPMAERNILLVEATTTNDPDLYAAVDYARNRSGVVAVSMSWGRGEFSTETSWDSHLTTPSGHGGVTFVASSGDYGAPPSYPAASPNVLSVGGTSLSLNPDQTWMSETGWSGSVGGYSSYEAKPSYQAGIPLSSSQRMNPDVAYHAGQTAGYAVYDNSGWIDLGGTSAGAPQWAALIAIADQGRAASGLGSLDGPSQTLSLLYGMPATDFHDITTGYNGYHAGPGYDLITGLGSPHAPLVVRDLSSQVGNEFLVNTQTGGPQGHAVTDFPQGARIASDASGAFVVVYESNMNAAEDGEFFAKLYDAAGNVVRNEFPVNPSSVQRYASVAMADDGHFVIAWDKFDPTESDFDVYFQRYDARGNPVGDPVLANTVHAGSQVRPEVGMDGAGNIVVSWNGNGPGDPDGVFVRRFNADGSARDPQEILVNSTFGVDYRELDQTLMVDARATSQSRSSGSSPTGRPIRVFGWCDSTPMERPREVRSGSQTSTPRSIRHGTAGPRWMPPATSSSPGKMAARAMLTGSMHPVSTRPASRSVRKLQVNTTTAGRQMSPTVGLDAGGDAVIAWTSVGQDGDGPGVYAQRFDPSGSRVGSEFQVNATTTGTQNTPTLASINAGMS